MPVKATYEKTEYYQYHTEAISTPKMSGCSTPTKDQINADARYGIITAYRKVKEIVLRAGFSEEILWQASVNFNDVTESDFLREHAWVTLSAGMQERVIRKLFQAISSSFYNFESAKIIVENESCCRYLALKHFNNIRKVNAIILAAYGISSKGFSTFKEALYLNPLEQLQSLPYIGPVTCYHLAKNIGLQVAKPDRHLTRLANYVGYRDVQLFCKHISLQTGDSIPVVDIVLWRFASITESYLDFFLNAAMCVKV
jgi:hypothetical protein